MLMLLVALLVVLFVVLLVVLTAVLLVLLVAAIAISHHHHHHEHHHDHDHDHSGDGGGDVEGDGDVFLRSWQLHRCCKSSIKLLSERGPHACHVKLLQQALLGGLLRHDVLRLLLRRLHVEVLLWLL
eukprot:7482537-Lingulodinium_polyedra.AAC.1